MSFLIFIEPLCLYKHPFSLQVNNLIHFYEWFKKIVDARKVFKEIPERTVVSWNSVMTAYVGSLSLGDFHETIKLGFKLNFYLCC